MARAKTTTRKRKSSNTLPMMIIGVGFILVAVVLAIIIGKGQAQDDIPAVSGENVPLANGMASVTPVKVEFAAPELSLKTIDGEQQSLADYRGQVVLVNNWATWCPPCTAEMPELQAFYEEYSDDGLVIVAIEAGEPIAEVTEFAESNGLTFPVWYDPGKQALRAFNNLSLPSSYVIDAGGTVRLAWTGAISKGMLERYVVPLLGN